ncbi:MAG: thiamine phosphate synthase [Bacteroidetes bacterium]|nr:thiamine phosphate synthase [Bacteroidota bacterium]
MKLIVISSPENIPNEIGIINSLFENGLEIFHIHKHDFSEEEIKNYFGRFPKKYSCRIFYHSQFPKFYSLNELDNYYKKYEYAFLSPIFDSISKINYKSKFDLQEVKERIKHKKIIALGGIDEDKISICHKLGFAGVAVLGAIWNSPNSIEKFKRLKLLCHAERSEASVLDSSLRSE